MSTVVHFSVSGYTHISGNSTFRGFTLKEKFVVTSSNYSSVITKFDNGIDIVDQLDLINVGPWVEFTSIPSSATLDYINLPAIRIGEKYSDAYRDYVRQFVGSEVLIYNSTRSQLRVDTGENSVTLDSGFASHFRMVFAPERMNSTGYLLERIKWEWQEPFQF